MRSLTEDEYQIVATALYYSDAKGRILLVTGNLPKEVKQIIQDDIKTRLKTEVPISVVPMYKNVDDIPYRRNVVGYLKQKFPVVYVANISKETSVNVFRDMRKHMLSPLKQYWARENRPHLGDLHSDGEDVPSIHPPVPKFGEVPAYPTTTPHSKKTKKSNNDATTPIFTGPFLVYGPHKGNHNDDQHNKPGDGLGDSRPPNTNFGYIDPSNNNHDNDGSHSKNGNPKPYTTNFSYVDPWNNEHDKDRPHGSIGNPRPYTTNFSYIDSWNNVKDKNKSPNDKPDNGPGNGNGKHNYPSRPYTTNLSYIGSLNFEKSTKPYDPLRPYTTNFSFIDYLYTGKPTDHYGQYTDENGNLVEHHGKYTDENGNPVEYPDRPTDQYGNPINSFEMSDPLKPYNYKTTHVVGTPPLTKGSWSQDEFIPNDIYYGIEKSCVNWNPLCSLKAPSLGSIPAKYINFPEHAVKPHFLQWVP